MLSPEEDLKQVDIPKEPLTLLLLAETVVPKWLEPALLLRSSAEPFLLSSPNSSLEKHMITFDKDTKWQFPYSTYLKKLSLEQAPDNRMEWSQFVISSPFVASITYSKLFDA